MPTLSDLLAGPDRLEPTAHRTVPLRLGNLQSLTVGDVDRVRQYLLTGTLPEQNDWLRYVSGGLNGMLTAEAEWVVCWPEALSRLSDGVQARAVVEQGVAAWSDMQPAAEAALFRLLSGCFSATVLIPEAAGAFRQYTQAGRDAPLLAALLQGPQGVLETVHNELARRHADEAAQAFERYWDDMRFRHERIGELLWALAGSAMALHGAEFAQEAQRLSAAACSTFGRLWASAGQMPADELALMLAEHWRTRFSGAGHAGSVEIVEEADRYRVVLQPCGSGGVMRRRGRATMALGVYEQPSAMTWSQPDVPAYCANCALNELMTVQRVGYPAWVTDYKSSASQACGWTVYKSPELIPPEYFERLHVARDPARFGQPRRTV